MDDFKQERDAVIEALERLPIYIDECIELFAQLKKDTDQSIEELKELNPPNLINIKDADERLKEWVTLLLRANIVATIAFLQIFLQNFSRLTSKISEGIQERIEELNKLKSDLIKVEEQEKGGKD